MQKTEDPVGEEEYQCGDDHSHGTDQAKALKHCPPQLLPVSFAKVDGEERSGTQGQPQKNGGQKGHQGKCGADGGQGVAAQSLADDQSVGDVV